MGKVKYRDELERRQGNQRTLRERYNRLKDQGLCVDCGQNPAVGGVRCTKCKLKPYNPEERRGRPREFTPAEQKIKQVAWNRESQRKRRERLREQGLCIFCGSRPADAKAGMCSICYDAHLERKRRSK